MEERVVLTQNNSDWLLFGRFSLGDDVRESAPVVSSPPGTGSWGCSSAPLRGGGGGGVTGRAGLRSAGGRRANVPPLCRTTGNRS